MPEGYDTDVGSTETLQASESLLFSIPINPLSGKWHIEIPFRFDLPHSGAIGGICFGFLSRLLIYAECPRGLGFDRGETLAVAISPERMWAYSTRFCRKPDNPAFQ